MESGDTVRAVRVAGKAGRRTRTDSPAGAVAYAHCPWNGLVSSVVLPGGVTASYAYDVMDRVTNVAWRAASGDRLGGLFYAYDAIGRVVSRRHDLGGRRFDRDYAYDAADRLASDGDISYTYDAAGNRLSRTGGGGAVAYAYGPGDRLAAWTGGSYGHDAAGCVTRIVRGGVAMDLEWDGLYRLVSVATNGVPAESYAYDALGRRVATTAAGGTERHVYDDRWQVIADLDADGRVVRSYVWGEGVDRLLAVRIGARTYAALTDAQGTVWGFADGGGRIAARWTYDAWGNVLSEEIAPWAGELRAVRYRFQGRELSAATGLIHFRARWYDPVTGRWLSPDPIGLEGGLNLHAFCANDPVNYADPSGFAYVNERSLDGGGPLGQFFADLVAVVDFGNRTPRHEEIFFEDDLEPKSAGYYNKKGVQKDESKLKYRKTDNSYIYYDDERMRRALKRVVKSGEWSGDKYSLFSHNCHYFADEVIAEYWRIVSSEKFWLFR